MFGLTKAKKVMLASLYTATSVIFTTTFLMVGAYWQIGSDLGVPIEAKIVGSVALGIIAFIAGLAILVTAIDGYD